MVGILNSKWLNYTWLFILGLSLCLFAWKESPLALLIPVLPLFVVFFIHYWKQVYWLLIISVPLSIQIWMMNDRLSTSLPDEPLSWVFLLAGVAILAWKPNILPQWFWRNKLIFILIIQHFLLLIATVYSQEPFFSIKFFIAKNWMLMAFVIFPIFVFKKKKDFLTAFWLILIGTTLTMLIIFSRHGIQYNFSFTKIEKSIDPIYYNHVDYSTIMSMVFGLVIASLLFVRRNWFLTTLVLGLIIFYLAAIYFAYARAAFLAVGFAFAILVAIRFKLVQWVMPTFYGLVIFILLFLSSGDNYMSLRPNFEKTYMRQSFKDHVKATFKGKDMSSMERIYRWIAGIRMVGDHPIVGHGPNSFYYYYKPHAVTTFRTWVSRNPEKSTSHNYFLYLATEQGIPAMIMYGVLLVVFFNQAQKTYHRFKDRFYRCATLACAMLMAACIINNFFSELLETHKIGALYYLSISLLVILTMKSKDKNDVEQQDKAVQPTY